MKLSIFENLYDYEILKKSKKIGEGSFGEVFLLHLLNCENADFPVLKIVPVAGVEEINGETQTTLTEVLAEIQVSLKLSQLGKNDLTQNFVEIRGCGLSRGEYPGELLRLWDEYDERKESLNDRPDFLGSDQLFVSFEFGNAGSDLETTKLNNALQGVSIFNQVAHALAVAENELSFEHRDLHWGNILVKPTTETSYEYKLDKNTIYSVSTHGMKATIIDFSLSRLSVKSNDEAIEIYKDVSEDPTLFTAQGDYQFEIYR